MTYAMSEPTATRTLVKSPPELWAELSDIESLARHLGGFDEIRITRLDPETTVAWEGDRARGTVHLEPSGWGTRVTLTAELPEEAAQEPEPPPAPPEEAAAEPEPPTEPLPAPGEPGAMARKRGFFARLFGRRRRVEEVVEVAAPEAEKAADAEA